ncbi:MFS transporter [Paenibacillus sp. P46E]|uniref:MDR family MFS transporter n=1 Tax=Paenibacillus sp. P46E TaxID=1349436 RepID=UPI00093CD000|nr:MFS transporter [Paenibacillus sp. P46E]OKP99773.1 MFS transporter [Paenibacillus sp. P46E]
MKTSREQHSKKLSFHPVAWGVIFGTFLSRTGFFMTIPFLGIYLGNIKGIDPATIGAILAVSLFIGTWGGFVGGALSDRIGRYPVMIASMALWSFVFIGFAFADATWLFFLLSGLNGLFRSLFEPTARALLADVTPEERRTDVFNARYFAINVGGAIGPLLGLKLGIGGSSSLLPFALSAAIYGLYTLLLIYFSTRYKLEARQKSNSVPVKQMLNIVFTDKVFLYFLIGNIFVFGAYSHLDTTLSQYIGHDRIRTYSFLFVINTLSVVVLQYPLAKLMKRFSSMLALKAGCVFFGLGLLGLGAFHDTIPLALSMIVFTIGEILSFVIGDVLIGEIAPAHLRGAYYGASGFAFIGQSICTWLGGILLQHLGFDQGPLIFSILMLLTFAAYPFFSRGQRLREQQTETVSSRRGTVADPLI